MDAQKTDSLAFSLYKSVLHEKQDWDAQQIMAKRIDTMLSLFWYFPKALATLNLHDKLGFVQNWYFGRQLERQKI